MHLIISLRLVILDETLTLLNISPKNYFENVPN